MWLGLHIKVNMYTKFQVDPIKYVEVCPDRQTDRLKPIYLQTSYAGEGGGIKKFPFKFNLFVSM